MIIYMYISRKHMQKKEIRIKSFVRIHWSVSEMDRQHPYNYWNSCYPKLCTKAIIAIFFK